MKFKNLFALVAVVFASMIQMGCGTQNPASSSMYSQTGSCASGQVLINGVCTYSATTSTATTCTSGTSYVGNAVYGCAVGYTQQGTNCVCNGTTTAANNGGCATGYYFFLNSCFPQGPCAAGYVLYTDQWCHLHQ